MDVNPLVLTLIIVLVLLYVASAIARIYEDGLLKKHLLTGLFIFILLNVLTLIGGVFNNRHSIGDDGFFSTLVVKIIFVLFYLLTTRIKTKLPSSLRLPLIRIIVWGILAAIDIFHNHTESEGLSELLYLVDIGICSLYTTLLYNAGGHGYFIEVVVFGIVLFALFEYAVIRISDALTLRILSKKKKLFT